ncbi:arginase [Pseudoalteromonas rubra]|uniref:arginase n=1 Tax=Pseudoalteromonas rubra TaxID=43658 RepID=UPI0013DD9A2E|nr:arginase [Pseudoalteromonas rubra]
MKSTFENAIVVECDLGAPQSGAALGGRALLSELEGKVNVYRTINTAALPTRQSDTKEAHYLGEINECLDEISISVQEYFNNNLKSLSIIAGDHSTACGSIAGLRKAFPEKKIGVVWIDAHADIHSPYTTPSGNVHGMPVAAAAGKDHIHRAINTLDANTITLWNRTKEICGQSIELNNLVYIGIRDLEQEEWDILEEEKIKYYSASEVNTQGARDTALDTLSYLSDCDILYVSFDIDSLDSEYVPGTGTPVDGGLRTEQAKEILSIIHESNKVKLFEVVEINPLLDDKNETAKCIADILSGIF